MKLHFNSILFHKDFIIFTKLKIILQLNDILFISVTLNFSYHFSLISNKFILIHKNSNIHIQLIFADINCITLQFSDIFDSLVPLETILIIQLCSLLSLSTIITSYSQPSPSGILIAEFISSALKNVYIFFLLKLSLI